ncbi:hypothetical protein KAI30_00525 [Candidatus Bathyarchaeota archaeon]|nr:hypothetical protein [Candidatus Bathyarchaeota archaeon]
MEKPKKKIAEAPDGYEYIWVVDPVKGRSKTHGGFIVPNKAGAKHYQLFGELRVVRTEKLHTHEGRRCIFADMPVFEVEK